MASTNIVYTVVKVLYNAKDEMKLKRIKSFKTCDEAIALQGKLGVDYSVIPEVEQIKPI